MTISTSTNVNDKLENILLNMKCTEISNCCMFSIIYKVSPIHCIFYYSESCKLWACNMPYFYSFNTNAQERRWSYKTKKADWLL